MLDEAEQRGVRGQESNSDSRAEAEHPPVARFPCIELEQLFNIGERQEEIPWEPFKPGVEIHRLYGDGISGPSVALLRFRPTGVVPLHEHTGYEHIIVLAGSQRDANGTAEAGTYDQSAGHAPSHRERGGLHRPCNLRASRAFFGTVASG